ncbi:MAG: FtsX-like permease family protein, partial [Bacteroidetes bacterium]|nr:FtsX-like permease family protein [Bacteroidota bacterium]
MNSQALEPGAAACQTWVLLNGRTSVKTINEKIKDLIRKQETTLNQSCSCFHLKKVLYYYSGGRRIWREMQNVVLIGCIGFAILLIACFNFINLTIALNIKRFREVGIKKVIGAQKSNIVLHHLGETSLITLISFLTSMDLVRLSVSILNRTLNGDVQFNFSDFRIILIFAGIALFTAIASGLLPALYLSSSRPVEILKGKNSSNHSFSFFRQGLIIFQFTIPVVLIIIVLIIKAQDNYLRNFNLGFDKEKLMIIYNTQKTEAHSESIRADLLSLPGIESVSFTNCIPARGAKVSNEVSWEGKDATQNLHFWCINTDFSYDKTVNLKISDGRYFDRSYAADSACFVINDIAAKVIGYDNPVGRTITIEGRRGTIIGVFRDFHTIDLAGPFTPSIISLAKEGRGNLLVKIASGISSELSGKITEVLKKYEPEKTFQVNVYSDFLKHTELTTASNLVGIAFFISILLACLG